MSLCRMSKCPSVKCQNDTLQMTLCRMTEWHSADRHRANWSVVLVTFPLDKFSIRFLCCSAECHSSKCRGTKPQPPSCSLTRLHRSRNLYNSVAPYLYNVLGGFKWKAGKFEKGPQESFLFSKVFLMASLRKIHNEATLGFSNVLKLSRLKRFSVVGRFFLCLWLRL